LEKFGKILSLLKWPIAIGLLVWLVSRYQLSLAELFQSDKDWRYFVAGFLLIFLSVGLTFVRWFLLVWAQDLRLTLKDAVRIGGFALLCNYGGPGIVGGDIVKAAFVARKQESRRAVAAATVVLDRVLGLWGLFIVGAASTWFVHFDPAPGLQENSIASQEWLALIGWGLWVGALGGLALIGMMLFPGSTKWPLAQWLAKLKFVGKTWQSLLNGIALYQSRRRVVALALGMSLLTHLGMIAGFYCCAKSLNSPLPPLAEHYYFMPAAQLFASVIPLPGRVGPLEGAISLFYRLTARPGSVDAAGRIGLEAALVFRVVSVLLALLGGGYYLLTRPSRDEKSEIKDQSTPM